MAQRLLRPLRRNLLSPSPFTKTLAPFHIHNPIVLVSLQTRYYVSEMRKSAFDNNILRLLRNDIDYELERFNPSQPPPSFDLFSIDHQPGEQWIKLTKKFGDNEEIRLEATMFDASVPVPKPGGVTTEEDIKLHMTLIVNIFKGDGGEVMEFVCSVWPDSVEIQKVYTRRCDQIADQLYMGPLFKELDDNLQISLYGYLEERGISDDLAAFLHAYMKNKDKTEHIRWMGTVKSFIEKK